MEAMDKIRDEMAKSQNPAVQELGESLTDWLSRHPEGAERILAEGKTLDGGATSTWRITPKSIKAAAFRKAAEMMEGVGV